MKSLSRIWKKIKKVVIVVVVVIVAVYTGGAALGALGYGSFGAAASAGFTVAAGASVSGFTALVAAGAASGFAAAVVSTKLNGGTWSQALRAGAKGAIVGAVSAGVAYGIGNVGQAMVDAGHSATAATATRAVLHGISRAAIAKAQNTKTSSGFWSAFASTILGSVGANIAGNNYTARVITSAVIGGTTSEISGGTFANGAVTGAFVFMFNDALHEAQEQLAQYKKLGGKGGYIVNETDEKDGWFLRSSEYSTLNTPEKFDNITPITEHKAIILAVSFIPGTAAVKVGSYVYRYAMMNPNKTIGAIEIANDIFNPSAPIPTTVKGTYGSFIKNLLEF